MASNQFSTTTHYVMPTRNDVAPSGYEGYGRVLQELTFAPLLHSLGGMTSWIVDGFELPSAGAGITSKTITAGEAVIGGYRVATHSTGFSVDFYDDTTNYVYLRLLKTLSKVTEVVIVVNDTGTQPSDSVLLGEIVTASGSISTSTDLRPSRVGPVLLQFTGDGAATQNVTWDVVGDVMPSVFLIAQWAAGANMGLGARTSNGNTIFHNLGGSTVYNDTDYPTAISGGLLVDNTYGYNASSRLYNVYILA